jgi:hypothetical protein
VLNGSAKVIRVKVHHKKPPHAVSDTFSGYPEERSITYAILTVSARGTDTLTGILNKGKC